jgi:hypothetical protein
MHRQCDWAGSIDDMRSILDYTFSLSFGVFFWAYKKKQWVAQSLVEVEYLAVAKAINQAIYMT